MGIIKGLTLFVWFTKLYGFVSAWKLESITFDDFLDRLEKLQKLNPEAAATDQLQTLKIELRFLKTLFKCIVRNSNLKECSSPVISSIKRALWGLFSEYKIDTFHAAVSNGLEAIEESRTYIRYFYELVPILSKSCVPMTNDILVGFMNDLVKNLEDLLCYKVNLVVPVKRQIEVLKEEMIFLGKFLCFAANRCGHHGVIRRFSAHLEGVAADAACFSYSCLIDKESDEKFSSLLGKMRSVKQEVREIYIQVLQASSKSSRFIDEHVLDAIEMYKCYVDNMLEIMNFETSFKLIKQDQVLKKFNDGLKFLKTLLMEPPTQYIEAEILNELLRSIDAVALESGSLLFSLYVDEMNEEIAKRVNLVVVDLLENVEFVKRETRDIYYLKIPKSSQCKFPKIDGLGFIMFFLESLKDLLGQRRDSINFVEHHAETIRKDFEFLIPLLGEMEEAQHFQHEELGSLWTQVLDVAYRAEYVIDSFVIKDGSLCYHLMWLEDLVKEIQLIKADVTQNHSRMSHFIEVDCVSKPSSSALYSQVRTPMSRERIVGFGDEAEKVIGLLVNGTSELDTVSIVGMPGAGKTTLAKKAYNSVSVEKHFHIRAWCTVSQVYQKRDLLFSILDYINLDLESDFSNRDAEELAQVLYKRLKGRRYLVVMDDIWNIGTWQDLHIGFPNDENGSRVLFTTRVLDVALHAKLHSNPHLIRPFNQNECWELLQELVFLESCPPELVHIGKKIAKSCNGLPLSVVLISGFLAADKTESFWKEVARSLSSRIMDDPQTQCKDIIGLSYKHLPNHLKPCLLYFGAFLEDQVVLAKKLKRLWSAEGLVRKVEGKRIEDTAEDYLRDLQNRSLITMSTCRSVDDGIKRCHVHDLLSQFCKAKSKEELFWEFIDQESHSTCDQRRLCLYGKAHKPFTLPKPSGSNVRSLLFCAKSRLHLSDSQIISSISNNFKLLRVLDLCSLDVGYFPIGLELLLCLKYLDLWIGKADFLPPSVANLQNLETFLIRFGRHGILELKTILRLRKLRHLHIRPLANIDQNQGGLMDSDWLDNLETVSGLLIAIGEEQELFRKLTNVRNLKFTGWSFIKEGSHLLNFELLNKLESLVMSYVNMTPVSGLSLELSFPSTLTKLTLYLYELTQERISAIGRLENLAVLKLRALKILERRWEMKEGEFSKLRHLQLREVDFDEWNADVDHFPCLRRLQLSYCYELRNIPSCLGNVATLEMIEVRGCPRLPEKFVREIQQEQIELGNDEFKLLILH